ncbi:class I SAM-dependent methyltransferase [Microbacterium sp. zg-B185]|uniref:class I SAM-dependent methyltransferase n=2 Tax=Microbacterium TaxID=33882 RepID=UPI00254BF3F3|nr:class I SAM-dependent methyltransferase [Microbacterium sp. zg-B185]WIM20707.1 class I SAM-dependent methyltransferase [Microbacterium sp. zg-B185]
MNAVGQPAPEGHGWVVLVGVDSWRAALFARTDLGRMLPLPALIGRSLPPMGRGTYGVRMGFEGAAVDYDRFMGRYSELLSSPFSDFAGVQQGQRVLDVGCGPGALTAELVARLGAAAVTGVEPSVSYSAAARERFPGARIEMAAAGDLPFEDAEFDVALAQLVVHFMSDPVHDLREVARVVRPGGVVAACVWDHAGGTSPLSQFWEVLSTVDPDAPSESERPGTRRGQLGRYLAAAGLREIAETVLTVRVLHPTFEDWWQPYERGVGPVGAYIASLDDAGRLRLQHTLRSEMPPAPFEVTGSAWTARGTVPA